MQAQIESQPRHRSPIQPGGRGPLRLNCLVRAAYELAVSSESLGMFLEGVAERAEPILGHGLGMVACRGRWADNALLLDDICFVGCPAEASAWRLEAAAGLPKLTGGSIEDQTLIEIGGAGLDGATLYLIAPSASLVVPSPLHRADLVELASHLRAALTLRSVLGAERRSLPEALPFLRRTPGQCPLRAEEAEELWGELLAGQLCLVAHTEHDGRRLVLARHKRFANANARPLTERERQAAQLAVRGRSTKEVADEIGVADVTGAVLVVSAIRRLGLRSRVELTEVDCTDGGARCLSAWRFDLGEERYVLFETSLRRLQVPGCLSHAEREVVRGVLDERSNGEIARSRRTSYRTVANQLSSIYWKLGISGRSELIETCSGTEAAVPRRRPAPARGQFAGRTL